MPMAEWAAPEWAEWICKKDGRAQRVQNTADSDSRSLEIDSRHAAQSITRDAEAPWINRDLSQLCATNPQSEFTIATRTRTLSACFIDVAAPIHRQTFLRTPCAGIRAATVCPRTDATASNSLHDRGNAYFRATETSSPH